MRPKHGRLLYAVIYCNISFFECFSISFVHCNILAFSNFQVIGTTFLQFCFYLNLSCCTLIRWMSSLDGRPGFNRQILQALHDKHAQDPWQYTLCSIMIDGMSMRSHLEYDPSSGRMVGFTDLGLTSVGDVVQDNCDSADLATEALVILVVGLMGYWKAPVAYFLTSKLSSVTQGELMKQVILAVEGIGLSVAAMVMDGLSANVKMVKNFGCNLELGNLNPFFPNPANPLKKIAVIFDACHMVKLMRNTLHSYKAIAIPGKGIAQFEHFRKLHLTQEEEGLRAGNRLTARHVDFVCQKMKVKLAAQLFSASVAKALELARCLKLKGLEHTEGTQYLCTVMDRLFDILNSKSPRGHGFKAALTLKRLDYHREFLLEAEFVLLNMTTVDGRLKICESPRSMGAVGLACNIRSVIFLAESLLTTTLAGRSISYILTYKFSQDHLEILFSCIRKAGGWNNNPSARQFEAIFKKLMFRIGVCVTSSDNTNVACQDETSLVAAVDRSVTRSARNVFTLSTENFSMFEDAMVDHSYSSAVNRLSPFIGNVLVYVAGWVVRVMLKRLKCVPCMDALISNAVVGEEGLLLSLKDNGGLKKPSKDVVKVIKVAENVLRSTVDVADPRKSHRAFGLKLEMRVLSRMPNNLFSSLRQHFDNVSEGCDNHYYSLLRLLCKCFIDVRSHHIAHMSNIRSQKEVVRHSNNKMTLFRNQ